MEGGDHHCPYAPHHPNLARLWGFCAAKGVRILAYEYRVRCKRVACQAHLRQARPTTDLNEADDEKPILDWDIRYWIAMGVARAIVYLLEECLEWVLHRDIQPENTLYYIFFATACHFGL